MWKLLTWRWKLMLPLSLIPGSAPARIDASMRSSSIPSHKKKSVATRSVLFSDCNRLKRV
jgi:hypothetical protein